ncbi:TonB-dependent receptor [Hyphomonas sp. FCG-A18]|uniref:TonB-dependent receptor domain-containing protein n=1 Tax=Hyphomonas sp. FCG-A18 TaxID=3080019 RepID=UPI002B2D47B6|nr:TonB-dependent receptor [Hyphomonas sp. FCG-A18]
MNGKTFRNRLLASSVFAGAAMAVVAAPAVAQEDEAEAVQETVLVTGSRIAKQDFVSNSPIATVDAETFELTGSVNTEDVLNSLPQAIPGFDRTSNNPGDGTATANLRGLGSARTLVLVDGRRMVPARSDGVVDLNTIPPAMIERVEVITGGASAVYGSDAIAGVVNFILKDDFEGFEANLGYESTVEYGDAQFWSADFTIGANFDNGRGNVTTNFSFTDREDVFASQRDFAAIIPGGGGSSGVPDGHTFDTFDFTALGVSPVLNPTDPAGISCGVEGTSIVDTDGSLATMDDNGNPLTPFTSGDEFCGGQGIFAGPDGFRPWIDSGANSDRYNYAPVNYLQLPQERFATTTIARYEITDDMEVYGRFTGSFNQVPQQLAPTPAFTSITTQVDNPFLSDQARAALAQLDTDGDGSATTFIGRRMEETGGRISNDDRFAFQFQVGLQGLIADRYDYDVYFQKGRTQNNNDLEGDISLDRFLQAVNVTADANGNAVCVDTSNGCAPLNLFGQGNISAEAANFVRNRINAKSEYNQTVFGASLAGDTSGLIELPGGPIGWAFGGEYREETFDFRPSDALAQGNILGFNAAPPVSGGFDVYDVFAEFYAPILADVPFAEILAVEGAIRVSDYSTVGQTEAYKVGGEWAPVEGLRFRTLFNTAVRAPNVAELFSPQSNGFPGAQDPCSTTNRPVANGIATLCAATGVPANLIGDTPEGDPANPAFYQQRNSQIESLFNGVNPDLAQEEAETLTVGAVWEPYFIDGLTIAVDYYTIEIEDYITSFGGGAQGVLDQCYGAAFNPSQDPNNPFCIALNRQSNGEALPLLPNANSGFLETSGIDISANYGFDVDAVPGDFTVTYAALLLDKWDFQASAASDVQDCAGFFGNFCDDPIPEYKHNATFGWANGPFQAQLRWEYIGEAEDDGGSGTTIDATSYFNINGAWDVNDNLRISGGIDNLLDEEPQILPDSIAEQANTYPGTYDVFGRTAYVSAKVRF